MLWENQPYRNYNKGEKIPAHAPIVNPFPKYRPILIHLSRRLSKIFSNILVFFVFITFASFVIMFSKSCLLQRCQKASIWGKGLNLLWLLGKQARSDVLTDLGLQSLVFGRHVYLCKIVLIFSLKKMTSLWKHYGKRNKCRKPVFYHSSLP